MSRTPECFCGECKPCRDRQKPWYAEHCEKRKAIRRRVKLWPDGICACGKCNVCSYTNALLKEPFGPVVYMQAGDYVNLVG